MSLYTRPARPIQTPVTSSHLPFHTTALPIVTSRPCDATLSHLPNSTASFTSCDPVEISTLGLCRYPTHSTCHRSNATSPLAHYPISASRTWILSFRHRLSHPVFTCKTHRRLTNQFIENAIRPTFTLASLHTLPTSRIYLQLAATFASRCYQPFYHLFIDYCAFTTWLLPLDLPPQFLLGQKPIYRIPIRKRLRKHLRDVMMKSNLFSGNSRK